MDLKINLKGNLKTPERILSLLAMNRNVTVTELMQQIDKSESAIQWASKNSREKAI